MKPPQYWPPPPDTQNPWKKYIVTWSQTLEHSEVIYAYSEAEARGFWRHEKPDSEHTCPCGDTIVDQQLLTVKEIK